MGKIHSACAIPIILIYWGIGIFFNDRWGIFRANYSPLRFVPSKLDVINALFDVCITLIAYSVAGWLIISSKRYGKAGYIVFPLILVMAGIEFIAKAMAMGLSLNYDYWTYVTRSLPWIQVDLYLSFPIIGLACGCVTGVIWKRIQKL